MFIHCGTGKSRTPKAAQRFSERQMQRTTHLSECFVSFKIHASTQFCIRNRILTSPYKYRRIFKCCIIISYPDQKSKGFGGFFSLFAKIPSVRMCFLPLRRRISTAAPENEAAVLCFFVCLCLLRRTDRTCICASAAVKTCIGVDDVLAVTFGNRTCRTCVCASAALDACIADCICHSCFLLYYDYVVCVYRARTAPAYIVSYFPEKSRGFQKNYRNHVSAYIFLFLL